MINSNPYRPPSAELVGEMFDGRSGNSTMRIEYRLTFLDYLLFNSVHQLLSIRLQLTYIVMGLVLGSIFLEDSGIAIAAIASVLIYVFMWLFQLVFNVFYTYSSKNRSLLTSHVIELQPDALYEETEFHRSFYFWHGLVKVVKRPGFVAIYITSMNAHIIPRRAFSSAEQAAYFVDQVEARLRRAKDAVA